MHRLISTHDGEVFDELTRGFDCEKKKQFTEGIDMLLKNIDQNDLFEN